MSIVRQIGSALDAAHAVGVVHRDLKPANVILMPAAGQAPVVKVIDFGISISDWSAQITTESRVMGTPEFMSPEQALGRRDEIDARSDQFALAVLAYSLLARSGHRSTATARWRRCPRSFTANRDRWRRTSPGRRTKSSTVLRKGMARARDDRFGSVLELVEALDAALARSGALAEPARACPSASVAVAASRSDPAMARLLSERRTPVSGGSRPVPRRRRRRRRRRNCSDRRLGARVRTGTADRHRDATRTARLRGENRKLAGAPAHAFGGGCGCRS